MSKLVEMTEDREQKSITRIHRPTDGDACIFCDCCGSPYQNTIRIGKINFWLL